MNTNMNNDFYNRYVRPPYGWKRGVLYVIALIILGFLVGLLANHFAETARGAEAQPMEMRMVAPCDACQHVTTKMMGVRKFRHHRLGHAATTLGYSRHNKRLILNKLMAVQARKARTTASGGGGLSRAAMWKNFTSHDNCVYRATKGAPDTAYWTCGSKNAPKARTEWTSDEVRGVICGGMAGIEYATSFSAGTPPGAMVYVGIGSAYLVCMWAASLENSARH